MLPDADIESGKELFFNCTKCHGTEGWASYGGEYPQVAGQHASVIEKQLLDIRSGKRENPPMLPVVVEMDFLAISNVAAYISTLKMNPDPGTGDAEDDQLQSAADTYQDKCAECHGNNGEGDALKNYPLLQGQNYEYLLRQLKRIQAGTRKNANKDMQKIIAEIPEQALMLLADYISRLEPDEAKLAPYGWSNPDYQTD